jgi:NAD-specific glutamate dehydrogenase
MNNSVKTRPQRRLTQAELDAFLAKAMLMKADEVVFPGWTDQDHVAVELFREFTKLLAKQYPGAGLHGRDKDFVDRCIKLLQRANYRGKSNG